MFLLHGMFERLEIALPFAGLAQLANVAYDAGLDLQQSWTEKP